MKPAVLCVERGAINQALGEYPMKPGIYPLDLSTIPEDRYHFINRGVVDTKNTTGLHARIAQEFPQLLCYITVRNQDQLLSYSRGTGAESRLHAFRSVGFGGHVDIKDVVIEDDGNINALHTLADAAEREMEEELDYRAWITVPDTAQLIIDNSNPVSAVHIGIWIDIILPTRNAVTANEEISDPQWISIAQLKQDVDKYEPWSQLIINQL